MQGGLDIIQGLVVILNGIDLVLTGQSLVLLGLEEVGDDILLVEGVNLGLKFALGVVAIETARGRFDRGRRTGRFGQ